MSPKIKVILEILLAIAFFGAFITGELMEEDPSLFEIHETLGTLSFILMITHLISNWRIIKNFGNILKTKLPPKS